MKKERKSLLSGLRPQILKILEVDECLQHFKEFCVKAHTIESLDCILEIKNFMESDEILSVKQNRLNTICKTYVLGNSDVNINAEMRNNLLRYNNETIEIFTEQYETIRKALESIRDELIGILGWRVPHFVESKHWHEFTLEYPQLLSLCLSEMDQKKYESIRYRKEDFLRDRFSEKEVLLCEFMKDDQSMFKLEKSDLDGCLSVFSCDGSVLLDEKDIGMGKFQGFKVAGSLPYPSWLIILALSSSKFHAGTWEGYRFDREYDFRFIPSSEENGQLFYDTHISKLVVKYTKLAEHRSCYCMTENLYKSNRTYMVNKSITPQAGRYVPNYYEEDINQDIFGEYETLHSPLGDNQSLFSYGNLTNPGGMLLSKLGTPQKRLLDIATTYRENIIGNIKKILENDGRILKTMESVYSTVKTRLDRYKIASKSTDPHIFELSFEEQLKNLVIPKE
ncbi:predicted protein [Naegleria gruberi]|uniref:Predicted protein n=1 Tax=Naegleria gruberi TaxID=5762 RepID=D2VGG3_NAEGR|nr:uncharacterized protein NAEGRDRAFT_67966 [Naegleria gruberi]EFC43959.1 predicted protein [Naegleria gruberi]|eukprot:XP_002676703.1 predicted protein [Naegleria gruberi strain NEG-M]